ncbi:MULTISPECIES: branched-chain amino acid ABC transporter permease [Halorussus]|uniref:branched-chain amino acid ABC transporter permease n=1 Tax=Halorussus TaxID=1070314 RepID=UPI0020A0CF0C|nr:branched-chain amino acid ABC transporter permease [Halorussus vallis]USZ77821.1 branched-chain amino acid ABC transporter permease [Halorussus vallis]
MMDPVADRWAAAGRRGKVGAALVVLLLAAVPLVTTPYITEIVLTGLVLVMLGVSWNMLAGYAGQISLGHAAFFGLGAFVTAWLVSPSGAGLPESIAQPALVAIFVGALVAALLALLVGPIMFRLRGHYFAIGTLALATIIQLILVDQRQYTGGSTGYFITGGPDDLVMYLVALALTLVTVVVTYAVVESRPGLGMKAIHDDESAASSLGVNPLKYKMFAFVLSSFFAGLAGGLYAQYTAFISPDSTLGVVWTIDTLVVVILGGMGTMAGPLLGAALFIVLDNFLSSIVGGLATSVEGALIILFVIFLPGGLYGFVRDRTSDERPPASGEPSVDGRSSDD